MNLHQPQVHLFICLLCTIRLGQSDPEVLTENQVQQLFLFRCTTDTSDLRHFGPKTPFGTIETGPNCPDTSVLSSYSAIMKATKQKNILLSCCS